MSKRVKAESTISIDGGPEVPMSVAMQALDLVQKGVRAVLRQTDIEDFTGKEADNPKSRAEGMEGRNATGERLRSLVERIERLDEERKALGSDIKDVFSEAKWAGFDIKVLRQLIRLRKQEPAEVEEQETLLDVYRRAIGM